MARRIRGKRKKITPKRKIQNNILTRIKFTESYTNLILGAIVVLIAGILFISFARGNRNMQTSSISTKEVPKTEDQKFQNPKTSSTYTVKLGDDLWTISKNIYNDGFRWVEIAKINNLENPGLIYVGSKLTIPTVAPNTVQKESETQKSDQISQTQNSIVQNNSITENNYIVVKGDNLWDIAVRAYGDGFKWPEIARANNLTNPDLIFSGNVFTIPR